MPDTKKTFDSISKNYDLINKIISFGMHKKWKSDFIKLSSFKPAKIIAFTLVAAFLGFIYLTHVFATQKLLGQVHQLQEEYEQSQQLHDDLKLRYNQMTGPVNIPLEFTTGILT